MFRDPQASKSRGPQPARPFVRITSFVPILHPRGLKPAALCVAIGPFEFGKKMCPTLFKIPWLGLPIRGYGLMLMIAFLGGTWWAARRADRVKADPDLVVNLGFVALIFSVIGARIFYVVHYWDRFAGQGLWKVVNLTAGGLEFYGGFVGAFVATVAFLVLRRVSVRLYADIVAPSLMFGMGAARIGCFLNGCCWGAPAAVPWAVRFPYASPAQYRQWEDRMMTVPAELIVVYDSGIAYPLSRDYLDLSKAELQGPGNALKQARQHLSQAETNKADAATLAKLRKQRDQAQKAFDRHKREIQPLLTQAQRFGISIDKLIELARAPEYQSLPVHPAQLYASLDGLLLAALLSTIFYRRKRHGVVFGWLLLLYPLCRIVEEIIRIDNPHDTAGLTISQFVSLLILISGAVWMTAVYRMPIRSPKAVPYVPPHVETKPAKKHKSKKRR